MRSILVKFMLAALVGVALLGSGGVVAEAGEEKAPVAAEGEVKALQERMLADPQVLALIMALQNDPAVQEILSDPDLMGALQAGNFDALVANPRFRALLDNPKVQEIEKRLH